MPAGIQITSRLLVRNWALNLGGQAVPLLAAVVTIPYITRGLGAERFGIFSIVLAVFGSVGMLDFGLGRATTKFVAESMGRGDEEKLPSLVWTSILSQILCGLAVMILGFLLVPIAVDRFLKISVALQAEARTAFFILAASFPIVLAANGLRGVLEAVQRFDVVNLVKIPSTTSVFLLAALALSIKWGLPAIVCLIVIARALIVVASVIACLKVVPALRKTFVVDLRLLRPMMIYGGWITVSNFLAPLLLYGDRFLIGSILSMAAVSYYTVPNEMSTRLAFIPGTLVATLFPAFASLDASGSKEKVEELCVRSVKSLLLLMGPGLLLIASFAPQILRFWLGPDFAAHGAIVLQICLIGTLVNSLACVPFCLLQALGRTDLTAKFHLMEIPLYMGALWFLLPRMGLAGAALAYTLMMIADSALLFAAIFRLEHISVRSVWESALEKAALAIVVLGVLLVALSLTGHNLTVQVSASLALLVVFIVAAWRYVLDQRDRSLFALAASQLRTAVGRVR